MVAAGSAWGLALSHAGVPVHVWRCRRPFPYGGLDPLRRETSAATAYWPVTADYIESLQYSATTFIQILCNLPISHSPIV